MHPLFDKYAPIDGNIYKWKKDHQNVRLYEVIGHEKVKKRCYFKHVNFAIEKGIFVNIEYIYIEVHSCNCRHQKGHIAIKECLYKVNGNKETVKEGILPLVNVAINRGIFVKKGMHIS